MSGSEIVLCIVGMTAVTFLPRVLPITFLAGRNMPRAVRIWLSFVPVTILSALLLPDLLLVDGQLCIGIENIFLAAAIPTLVVCCLTRSLFAALAIGLTIVAVLRYLWA